MRQLFRHCPTAKAASRRRAFRALTASGRPMVAVRFQETAAQPDQRPDLPRSGHCGAAISDQVLGVLCRTFSCSQARAPVCTTLNYKFCTSTYTHQVSSAKGVALLLQLATLQAGIRTCVVAPDALNVPAICTHHWAPCVQRCKGRPEVACNLYCSCTLAGLRCTGGHHFWRLYRDS